MLTTLSAQKKVVLEPVLYGTALNYLRDVQDRRLLLRYLNDLLGKHRNAYLADTTAMELVDLRVKEAAQQPPLTVSDTSVLYLSLVMAEYAPFTYFNSIRMDSRDSALQKKVRTVVKLYLRLRKHDNSIVYQTDIDVLVSRSRGRGIGNESRATVFLPRTFVETMRTVLDLALDPAKDLAQLVVNVSPVFSADNYLLPRVAGMPRITVDTAKGISAFIYSGARQLLRQSEPFFEQLILKGKKAVSYPDEIMRAIRAAPNQSLSDFVFVRQEGRDVLNNKNYLLKLLVQVNPDDPSLIPESVFTNFMPGNLHVLLSDNDTIAKFGIEKNVPDKTNKLFPARLYNGIDTASMISIADTQVAWPVVYGYVVSGKIGLEEFEIKCSDVNNTVKEIFLNGKRVCIAQGKFIPEVFVVFDASLSPVLLNQLLIIGFNRFFQ